MPYIDKKDRADFTPVLRPPRNAGELNFALTEVCIQYMQANGLRYQQINDVLGALEGAKQEFYRRVAAPYEDTKIATNGDVYPDDLLS